MSDDALGDAIGAAVADTIEHACSVAYGCSVDEFCTDAIPVADRISYCDCGSDACPDAHSDEWLHPSRESGMVG
jgi:hypothetical protein